MRLDIYRTDLEITTPLVLGPGLVIDKIPYYCAEITDGHMSGRGWSVSSPLWAGLKHLPLPAGIALVEKWLVELGGQYLNACKNFADLSQTISQLHSEYLYTTDKYPIKSQEPIPSLVKGMILAPLENAACELLARRSGLSMIAALEKHFTAGEKLFTQKADKSMCPFLTISGTQSLEDVAQSVERFGKRPVVKFKIGSKNDPAAEAEFIIACFAQALPDDTNMVIDNNQAYTATDCKEIAAGLQQAGLLDKLLFFEQPFTRGREKAGFDKMFAGLDPRLRLALDESVGNVSDLERLGQLLSPDYNGNVLFIPKFEKGGFLELVRMLSVAKKYHIKVSPSTLTGPPPQLPQYWEIFRPVPDLVSMPGNPDAFVAEANGYEILNWPKAVQFLMSPSEISKAIFDTSSVFLTGSAKQPPQVWPEEATTRDMSSITWQAHYSLK